MNKTKSLHIQINFTSSYFSIQTWKVDKNKNIQVQVRKSSSDAFRLPFSMNMSHRIVHLILNQIKSNAIKL